MKTILALLKKGLKVVRVLNNNYWFSVLFCERLCFGYLKCDPEWVVSGILALYCCGDNVITLRVYKFGVGIKVWRCKKFELHFPKNYQLC